MRKTQVIGILLISMLLLLGACAPVPVPEEAPTQSEEMIAELQSQITALEEELAAKEATNQALQEEIQERQNKIEELEKALEEATPPPAEPVELKYDDSTSDGSEAIGGPGWGHVVHFSPPVTPFAINEVKIYGSLYGLGFEKFLAQIEVWDEHFNILYSCLEPHTSFSREPSWVSVSIPDITVDGDFYIFVYTSSPRYGGIEIHYDSSVINNHSEMTKARHIADWYMETPKDEVNWMIRVVGSQTAMSTSAEEEPVVKEIELKYDDGIGTGGTNTSSPGWGDSVYFSPPTIPFTIVQVKVFARLRTGYQRDTTAIEIWDKDFNVVYSGKKPATEFSSELEWATFDIPSITVDGDFRVVFFTNGGNVKEGGVGLSSDRSGNKGSECVKSGGKIVDWFPSVLGDEGRINWMIRVVGMPMAPD